MEPQIIFNVLFTIIGVLGGILLKSVQDSIKVLRDSIDVLPNTYRRRDDSTNFESRIEATLIRIEGKLDRKADKQEHTHHREEKTS